MQLCLQYKTWGAFQAWAKDCWSTKTLSVTLSIYTLKASISFITQKEPSVAFIIKREKTVYFASQQWGQMWLGAGTGLNQWTGTAGQCDWWKWPDSGILSSRKEGFSVRLDCTEGHFFEFYILKSYKYLLKHRKGK